MLDKYLDDLSDLKLGTGYFAGDKGSRRAIIQ